MSEETVAFGKKLLTDRVRMLAVAAAIAASACWGGATVMSKAALQYVPPLALFVIQLAASVTFLWISIRFYPKKFRWSSGAIAIGVIGLLEPGMAYLLGIIGLKFTSAINASIIMTSEPIIIVLIAWIALKEHISRKILLSICVALLGVLLVTGPDIWNIHTNRLSVTGDIFIALGTICAAAYVVLTHKLVQKLDPLHLLVIQQSYGLVFAIAIERLGHLAGTELLTGGSHSWGAILPIGWVWALLSGIVQYACAFWLYLIALKHLKANVAAVFLALIPVFGMGGAYLFLGEALTWNKVAGAAMIIMAIIAASRDPGSAVSA